MLPHFHSWVEFQCCYCEVPHVLCGPSTFFHHGVLPKSPSDIMIDRLAHKRNIVPAQIHQRGSQDLLEAHVIQCIDISFGHEALEVVDEEDLMESSEFSFQIHRNRDPLQAYLGRIILISCTQPDPHSTPPDDHRELHPLQHLKAARTNKTEHGEIPVQVALRSLDDQVGRPVAVLVEAARHVEESGLHHDGLDPGETVHKLLEVETRDLLEPLAPDLADDRLCENRNRAQDLGKVAVLERWIQGTVDGGRGPVGGQRLGVDLVTDEEELIMVGGSECKAFARWSTLGDRQESRSRAVKDHFVNLETYLSWEYREQPWDQIIVGYVALFLLELGLHGGARLYSGGG